MERVKKGEKYWTVFIWWGHIYVDEVVDIYCTSDDDNWNQSNYFNTKEEAESMAKKLRAVMKGAEVIEMPSEGEIESVASKICHEIEKCGIVSGHPISGYMKSACKSMADFFNNKIVK